MMNLPGTWGFAAVPAACLTLGIPAKRDMSRLISCSQVRRAVAAFALLLV